MPAGIALVAGFGNVTAPHRYLALDNGRPSLVTEAGTLTATSRISASVWHHVAATFDGTQARLLVDGRQVAQRRLAVAPVASMAAIAPRGAGPVFTGRVAEFAMQGRSEPRRA